MNEDGNDLTISHELVYELKVRDAMTTKLITATPENSLRDIQKLMRENRISGVPILDGDKLVGIVCLECIINALDKGYIEERVKERMTKNVITLRDNVSLVRASIEFEKYKFGRFPVVDENQRLVGIITRGDIITRIMLELTKIASEIERREAELIGRAGYESEEEVILEADVKAGDFDNAGIISSRIKKELTSRGVSPKITRRAAISAYEAEANIVIHSIGGKIIARILKDKIIIQAVDWGPGIEDIEKAMQPGFSTASEFIRTMGFGAGMGLNNIERCADKFEIESQPGIGTELNIEILFDSQKSCANNHGGK